MSKFVRQLIESLKQAIEHARGGKVAGMRVTKIQIPNLRRTGSEAQRR
jgi:hypothetical protein